MGGPARQAHGRGGPGRGARPGAAAARPAVPDRGRAHRRGRPRPRAGRPRRRARGRLGGGLRPGRCRSGPSRPKYRPRPPGRRDPVARLAAALPADIRVHAAGPAPDGFDARFSALWRRYSYRVCDDPARADPLRRHETLWSFRRLDLAAMNEAALACLGEHDFAAFCRRRPGATTVRTLRVLDWRRDDDGTAGRDRGRRRVLPQHGPRSGRGAAGRRRGPPAAGLAGAGARGRRARSRGPGGGAARAVPGGGRLPGGRRAGRAGRADPPAACAARPGPP